MLDVALVSKQLILELLPQAECLELAHQVGIDLEEFTVECAAAKDLAKLWVDPWGGARHMRDIGGGRNSHKRGIAHAAPHLGAQRLPVEAASGIDRHYLATLRAKPVDRIDRQLALTPATASKVRIATARHR